MKNYFVVMAKDIGRCIVECMRLKDANIKIIDEFPYSSQSQRKTRPLAETYNSKDWHAARYLEMLEES